VEPEDPINLLEVKEAKLPLVERERERPKEGTH
jgi:hypothetical protein